MKKKITLLFLAAIFVIVLAPLAFAAEDGAALPEKIGFALALGSALSVSIAAFGGGIGQGMAIKGAMEGIARNPGASGKIMTTMIIGLALIESLVIYSLVVSLMLLFKL
ncbi:MAG: ATP synthase F0 subunit C [bacterium]